MGNPGLRKRQRGTVPKGEHLGEFGQHVLAPVWRLRGDACGMNVRRYIAQHTGRYMAIGAVYATLDRLERKGFVRPEWVVRLHPSAVAGPRSTST